jgi:perosamine synthetase
MRTKIAQVGVETRLADIYAGYRGVFTGPERDFKNALADHFPAKHVYLSSSGTAAFFIILSALKSISSKKEVILPAYTAPAMVLPVLKAGLKPVLCDISLKDFNLDLDLLTQTITQDTLCVVPTHLFGIVNSGIESLKEKMPGVYVIEDCAQSFGSMLRGKAAGVFGDAAFFSFNRGKNLPTYGGGCSIADSPKLAESIQREACVLKEQGLFLKFILPLKIAAFSLAVRPRVYGALYSVIAKFKDERVPVDFPARRYTNFQSGFGLSLLSRIKESSQTRYRNGTILLEGLSGIGDLILPHIGGESRPAFNRFPILCEKTGVKARIEKALVEAGIDISHMYGRPLHHIFDLGYRKEDFPHAVYLAGCLLTLPVHPLVKEQDARRIVEVIRKICSPGKI